MPGVRDSPGLGIGVLWAKLVPRAGSLAGRGDLAGETVKRRSFTSSILVARPGKIEFDNFKIVQIEL